MGSSLMMGGTLGVAMMMTMTALIITDTSKCRASGTLLLKSNDTDHIVAYLDPETEFQMDSEINRRILQQKGRYTTPAASLRYMPVSCGRPPNQRYRCGGPPSGSQLNNCRSPYKRDCPRR